MCISVNTIEACGFDASLLKLGEEEEVQEITFRTSGGYLEAKHGKRLQQLAPKNPKARVHATVFNKNTQSTRSVKLR